MSNDNGSCGGHGGSCQGGQGHSQRDPKIQEQLEQQELRANLDRIKYKIVVLSGKGGVGKSTVAVNLAAGLAANGYSVGLLDIDIHGPSIPKLLGLDDVKIKVDEEQKMVPARYGENMKVVSIGFFINHKDEAVIWRGPMKHGAIRQFIKDVRWGDLDFLIIDSPPGTGDEPLAICQLIDDPTGAVIVTTPQDVALADVRKSITFCGKVNMPILGVVENMSGFTCPHCGKNVDIFRRGGGERMAEDMKVPFLGSIPLDADVALKGDEGNPFITAHGQSSTRNSIDEVISAVLKKIGVN